jgi:uncharacterized phage protein gp47/JayE
MTTNVPSLVFTSTGITVPDESAILDGTLSDIDAAFGGGLNRQLTSPQGQWATSLAAVVADKNAQIVQMSNNFNPDTADGIWQDALGRIYFLTRLAAQSTVVTVTVNGLSGTVIPAGTLVKDTNGNTYSFTGAVTIGDSGLASGEVQNIASGPIPCAAGTLTQVFQSVAGFDTITNAADGTLGRDVETRADFETRRKASVAANAKGTPESIYANVFAVADVLDCYVLDNPTGSVVTKGSTNYSMLANSVYVAAVGGVDADIAKAIWQKKDLGCSMNGNTSVTVEDQSGYSYPYPSYTVKFQRPSSLPIKFAVQVAANSSLPSNYADLVKSAIVARFNGTDGTTRERIGSYIYSSRYYGAVQSVSSIASILSILIGTSTVNLTSISVGIDQYPTISTSNITVTFI